MAKEKKAKKKSAASEKYKLAPIYIDNNIIYSKKESWAYYKITPSAYDFISLDAQINLANETITSLAAISTHTQRPIDGHILVTNTPFNVDSWEEQVVEIYDSWNKDISGTKRHTFDKFVASQVNELRKESYKRRSIYIGIKLTTRGAFTIDDFDLSSVDVRELLTIAKDSILSVLQLPTEVVDNEERTRTRSRERDIRRELRNGTLHAIPVSAEELLLTIKRTLHPGMPAPYLDVSHDDRIGLNDIAFETGGIIRDKHRFLEVSQIINEYEYIGYRAALTFTKFPKDGMGIPGNSIPFMYLPTFKGLPFTMSSRFTLKPSATMKKELDKKKADLDDELKNLGGSNQSPGAHVYEKSHQIDVLEDDLHEENLPWMSGVYRLVIEAPNEDILKEAASAIKNEYAKSDIVLTWTSGDQLQLLQEDILGGTQLSGDFSQLTNLAMLGTSGFNFGSEAGDPINEKNVYKRRLD